MYFYSLLGKWTPSHIYFSQRIKCVQIGTHTRTHTHTGGERESTGSLYHVDVVWHSHQLKRKKVEKAWFPYVMNILTF